MRCLPKVAEWAELPRAQVSTKLGGRRLRYCSSSASGAASALRLPPHGVGALAAILLPCWPGGSVTAARLAAVDARARPTAAVSRANLQCAGDRVAERCNKVTPRGGRQAMARLLPQGRRPARGDPLRRQRAVAPARRYGRRRGAASSTATGSLAAACSTISGAKAGEISRQGAGRPTHDRMRIGAEFCKQGSEQSGPRNAPVMRPQRAAQRLATEPGAAAFV